MKRLVALVLTIVIIAAVAVCFLRPGDPNPDFGGVPDVCTVTGAVEITDCTGDTDVLTAEEVQWARSGPRWLFVRMSASRNVFLTPYHMVDGEIVDDGGSREGVIEKLVNGEWREIADMTPHWADLSETPLGVVGNYTFTLALLSDDNPNRKIMNTLMIPMPEYEAGATYRFTYFFREMLQEYPRETGAELYSITHTVTIPAATDKRFDLVNWGLEPIEWQDDDDGTASGIISPTIRVNSGEAPYLDYNSTEFEVKDGGKWVRAVSESVYGALNLDLYPDDSDFASLNVTKFDGYYEVSPPQIRLGVDDLSADYRLTLHFTEHPDGSGEQYTLTLRLRFDE